MLAISLILITGCEDQAQLDINTQTSSLELEEVEIVQEGEKQIKEVPAEKEVTQEYTSETSEAMFQGYKVIQVDGGVDKNNVKDVIEAGANVIVAGSAVFGDGNIEENIKALRG